MYMSVRACVRVCVLACACLCMFVRASVTGPELQGPVALLQAGGPVLHAQPVPQALDLCVVVGPQVSHVAGVLLPQVLPQTRERGERREKRERERERERG